MQRKHNNNKRNKKSNKSRQTYQKYGKFSNKNTRIKEKNISKKKNVHSGNRIDRSDP